MSYSIDYFFNSEKSFEQLCEEMNTYLDFKFEPSKEYENHVYNRALGIGFDFYIHDFENDGTVNFEDYKYYIGLTGRPYAKDFRLSIMAFVADILYSQMGISDAILVFDVQRLLAKYKEELYSDNTKGLFDEVSNRFVEFPQHIIDLDKLAWQ